MKSGNECNRTIFHIGIRASPRGVLCCGPCDAGPGFADAVAGLARAAGWPLIADGASGLRRVTTERRDLMRRPLLAEELNAFGAVAMDPPRAGAEAQARALASSSVARVASVSCDPATFARDAAILVKVSTGLGAAMPGQEIGQLETKLAERGW